MPPVLLDGRELSARLDVRYTEVMSWYRRGWVPGIKTGCGRVVFDLDRVVRALRARERDRPAAARG